MYKTTEVLTVKTIVLPNEEVIPEETVIEIDLDKMVGIWDGYHFDVFRDEYLILN